MSTNTDNASQIQEISLVDHMIALRADVEDIDWRQYEALNRDVIGKFKQQYGAVISWYGQWEKNRDYSSIVNASLALGKLSMAFDLFCKAVEETPEVTALTDSIDRIFAQCWGNIQAAAGRITPYSE
jgi:hypothetical protein